MGKVNPNDYGGGESKPKLTPDVLGNVDVVVLTILRAQTGIGLGDRLGAVLEFEVQGEEYGLWLNKSGIANIVDKLGDDDEKWAGKDVPLVKVRNPNPRERGKYVVKYVPAGPDEWDDYIAEYSRRRRSATGRAARKRARR